MRRSSPHSIPEVNQAWRSRAREGIAQISDVFDAPDERHRADPGGDMAEVDRYARRVLSAMLASTRAGTSSRAE